MILAIDHRTVFMLDTNRIKMVPLKDLCLKSALYPSHLPTGKVM